MQHAAPVSESMQHVSGVSASASGATFIAFSGGVESTTMALLFGHKAQCVFTDTGAEHGLMYDRLNDVEKKLKAIHGDGFHVLRIKAEKCDGKPIDNLTDYIRHTGIFPNQVMRFCTKYFKIAPYNAFLRDKTPCSLMVGLNADEIEKREGNHGLYGVTVEYPLVDLGMNREKCKQMLAAYDLLPKLPPYMRRGGCKYCPYKSRKEYAAMVHLAPDEMEEIAQLEEDINQGERNTRGKFWAAAMAIPEGFRKFMETEKSQTLFTPDEMYGQQTGAIETACGVFCHR